MRLLLNDVELEYQVEGSGPPLILVHGGGLDLETWEDMVPLLAPQYSVHRLDMRGFGKTSRLTDTPLSMESWADDLAGMIAALGLHKPVLVGWSLGGAVSIECASRHPGVAGAIVVLGAPGQTQVSGGRAGFDRRQQLIDQGCTPDQVIDETFAFTEAAFSEHSRRHNPRAVEKIRAGLKRNFSDNYAEMVTALQSRSMADEKLAKVDCPTLVLVGDEDARTPIQMAAELNRGIPDSYMKVLAQTGHYYAYECPERCAGLILDYLSVAVAPRG